MRLAGKAVQDATRAEKQHAPAHEVEAALHSAIAQSRAARALHDLATAEAHYVHFMARVSRKLTRAVAAIDGSAPAPVGEDDSEDEAAAGSVLDELAGPGSELDALRAAVDASKSAAQDAAAAATKVASGDEGAMAGISSQLALMKAQDEQTGPGQSQPSLMQRFRSARTWLQGASGADPEDSLPKEEDAG